MKTIKVLETDVATSMKEVEQEIKDSQHYNSDFSAVFKMKHLLNPKRWFKFVAQHPVVSLAFIATIVAFALSIYLWVLRGGDGSTLITMSGLAFITAAFFIGLFTAFALEDDFLKYLSLRDFKAFYSVKEKNNNSKIVFSKYSDGFTYSGEAKTVFHVHGEKSSNALFAIEFIGDDQAEAFQDFLVRLDSLVSEVNQKLSSEESLYFSSLENFRTVKTQTKPSTESLLSNNRFDTSAAIFTTQGIALVLGVLLCVAFITGFTIRVTGESPNNYSQYSKVDQQIRQHEWQKQPSLEDIKKFVEQHAFTGAKHLNTLQNVTYCLVKAEDDKPREVYIKYAKKAVSDKIYIYHWDNMNKPAESTSYLEEDNCEKILQSDVPQS